LPCCAKLCQATPSNDRTKDKLVPARDLYINWMRGPMARRLTTNQEILGSIPSVFILFVFFLVTLLHGVIWITFCFGILVSKVSAL
jgi:hypothetical protein